MQPQFNNNLIDKIQKHRVKNQVHLMIKYLLESPLNSSNSKWFELYSVWLTLTSLLQFSDVCKRSVMLSSLKVRPQHHGWVRFRTGLLLSCCQILILFFFSDSDVLKILSCFFFLLLLDNLILTSLTHLNNVVLVLVLVVSSSSSSSSSLGVHLFLRPVGTSHLFGSKILAFKDIVLPFYHDCTLMWGHKLTLIPTHRPVAFRKQTALNKLQLACYLFE